VSAALGLVAEFRTADELSRALAAARREGYTAIEAFAPFPMRDEERAFAYRTWLIPFLATVAACIGAAIQYYSQFWMNAVDYPINVGGRPLHSWPAFIPSAIIVSILWAGVASFLVMLFALRLPRLHHPIFNAPGFERASQDRFFLAVECEDPLFDAETTRRFFEGLRPNSVRAVPQ
jgi:Protein of unknown function (DUF3341)